MTNTYNDAIENVLRSQVQDAMVKADQILSMIGVMPRLDCEKEKGKETITSLAGENICLHNMHRIEKEKNLTLSSALLEANRELSHAHETIAQLKMSIARYENRINQEFTK